MDFLKIYDIKTIKYLVTAPQNITYQREMYLILTFKY